MDAADTSSINSIALAIALAAVIVTFMTAIAASLAAFFTSRSANATMKASRGNAMTNCLNNYIAIMGHKSEAVEKQDKRLAENFYRELFDLHWNEFHLWQDGVISDNVMRAWLYVRRRNFGNDKITCSVEGQSKEISYESEWKKSVAQGYFEMDDPFVDFMNTAHSSKIDDMKKLKKETKR